MPHSEIPAGKKRKGRSSKPEPSAVPMQDAPDSGTGCPAFGVGASGGGEAIERTQVALEAERDFGSAVLETVAALVLVVDREGRIVRFNRACREASGHTSQEAVGRRPWELLVPAEEAASVRMVHEALAAGQERSQSENHWVRPDGSRRLIAWSHTAIRDRDGATTHVIRCGIDVTEQREAEEALERSREALRLSEEQLRTLTAGLLSAQEEERKRIAREIHDDLIQRLAMLAVDVETLEAAGQEESTREHLGVLRQRIGSLSDDLRRVAYQLHPSALEHLGLVVALESLCAEFSKAERIQVRFRKQDVPETLPADVALCIFRVTQECLRNVARHSGAIRAYVALVGGKDGIGLVISDRGTGFDLELVKGKKGLGLVSIAERVRLADGMRRAGL